MNEQYCPNSSAIILKNTILPQRYTFMFLSQANPDVRVYDLMTRARRSCQDLQPESFQWRPQPHRQAKARRSPITTDLTTSLASPLCILAPPHNHTNMSVSALIRSATRARVTPFVRQAPRALFVQQPVQRAAFSASTSRLGGDVDAHDPHHEESFEEFTARYALILCLLFLGSRWEELLGRLQWPARREILGI